MHTYKKHRSVRLDFIIDWIDFKSSRLKIFLNFRESNSSLSCQTSFPAEPSVFRESALSPSEIANYLRDELKRLRKRRQLAEPYPSTSSSGRSPPASPGSPEPMMADSAVQDRASPSGHHASVGAGVEASPSKSLTSKSKADRPVFTLKQMTMICEKMCKVILSFWCIWCASCV